MAKLEKWPLVRNKDIQFFFKHHFVTSLYVRTSYKKMYFFFKFKQPQLDDFRWNDPLTPRITDGFGDHK